MNQGKFRCVNFPFFMRQTLTPFHLKTHMVMNASCTSESLPGNQVSVCTQCFGISQLSQLQWAPSQTDDDWKVCDSNGIMHSFLSAPGRCNLIQS
jgi:hypothetical protein